MSKLGLVVFFIYFIFLQGISFSQNAKLGLPLGHTNIVNSVNYSPDGKSIVTASRDNTAKIWDIESGNLLHNLEDHTSFVVYANWSPDGSKIASASWDNTAKIWDANTGSVIHSLIGHTDFLGKVIWSPKGDKILTISFDKTAKIWDISSGKLILTLSGHEGNVSSAVWTSSGEKVITASWDKKIIIWNALTGEKMKETEAHNDIIFHIEYSPDNQKILSCSNDNTTKIWSASDLSLIFTLSEHTDRVIHAAWSNDSKKIISASKDNTAKLWCAETGVLLHSFSGHTDRIIYVAWSTDNNKILTCSWDETARIWDVDSKKLIAVLKKHNSAISHADWSPDNQNIALSSWDGTISIWNSSTGKLNKCLEGFSYAVSDMSWSPDQSMLLVNFRNNLAKICDAETGRVIHCLDGHEGNISSAQWSGDGTKVITSSWDGSAIIWDAHTGKIIYHLKNHSRSLTHSEYSPDYTQIITASRDSSAIIWDAATGKELLRLKGHKGGLSKASWSPCGNLTYTSSDQDSSVIIWDAKSGKQIFRTPGNTYDVFSAIWSPEGERILTASEKNSVKIWSSLDGRLLLNIKDLSDAVWSADWSNDGKRIALGLRDGSVQIIDALSGRVLCKPKGHSRSIYSISFSDDQSKILSSSWDKTAKVWNASDGKLIHDLTEHIDWVYNGKWFDKDEKIITGSKDGSIIIWNAITGKLIVRQFFLKNMQTVVLAQSGVFDASQKAMEQMYWVQGLKSIDLNQLKERYWEPGLWRKIILGDEVREAANIDEGLDLYPVVSNVQIEGDNISFKLTDQGGGIGKYIVYINGKEAFVGNDPASGKSFSGKEQNVNHNFKNHKYLLAGDENDISVVAYNSENYLSSRGAVMMYSNRHLEVIDPSIFIICVGVSDYTGNQIDLRYAAKDAEDICFSLKVGAKKLFGEDRTHTFLLTTNEEKNMYPTKANIKRVFQEIGKKSVSADVIVLYLAGHGINLGGQGGDFYFLTQEAYSANPDTYNDAEIRGKTTLSTNEFVDLFKLVPATKQVMMIDACASGQIVDDLLATRDISSSTIRAIDRMRDRTGMYILTGSAADAVSYEASKFGQGLLTYTLIEGIRGAALREGQFVDIDMLFQWSRNRVPVLAKGLGGIQIPQLFSPYGGSGFDIGFLEESDKAIIPLAKEKPVFVMSTFMDGSTFDDILGLEKLIDEELRGISSRGVDSDLLFFETKNYPEAYRLRGLYSIEDNVIKLNLNIFYDKEKISSFSIEGQKDQLKNFSETIINKIYEVLD